MTSPDFSPERFAALFEEFLDGFRRLLPPAGATMRQILADHRQKVTAAVDHVLQPLELTWWAFREYVAMTAPTRQAVRDLASRRGVEEAHLLV